MKKYILHIMTVAALIFTACGGGSSDGDNYQSEANKAELEGVLSEQETGDDLAGTHLLTADDGTETALRSIAINLSDEDYVGNELRLIGFLNPDDDVFEVTGVSILTVNDDEEEEDKSGEITLFKSSYLGFQIEHLDTWEVEELEDAAVFDGEDGSVVVTQVPFYRDSADEESVSPLFDYVETFYPEIDSDEVDDLVEVVGDDDMQAIRIEGADGSFEYLLYRNGLVYNLLFVPFELDSDELELLFKKMVSSFRFIGFKPEDSDHFAGSEDDVFGDDVSPVSSAIEAPDLGDMKFAYFESLPFNFRGEYPASWYYRGDKSSSSDVLRHYEFSDENFGEDGDSNSPILVSVDVITSSIPNGGTAVQFEGFEGVIVDAGSAITVYVSVDSQNYRISGDAKYQDVMLHMAASLEAVEGDDE